MAEESERKSSLMVEVIEKLDELSHNEPSFPQPCVTCNTILDYDDPSTTILNKTYCANCPPKCTKCKTTVLTEANYRTDEFGNLLCKGCASNLCVTCRKVVARDPTNIKIDGEVWHYECYKGPIPINITHNNYYCAVM